MSCPRASDIADENSARKYSLRALNSSRCKWNSSTVSSRSSFARVRLLEDDDDDDEDEDDDDAAALAVVVATGVSGVPIPSVSSSEPPPVVVDGDGEPGSVALRLWLARA